MKYEEITTIKSTLQMCYESTIATYGVMDFQEVIYTESASYRNGKAGIKI